MSTKTRAKATAPKLKALEARVSAATAKDLRAHEHARVTAAAWVAAVRVRVRELASQAGVLDALQGHPEMGSAALVLRCVLDRGAVGKFVSAVYALEDMMDEFLTGGAEPSVPDLGGALRAAGETSAEWFEAVLAEREARGEKAAG